MAEVGLLLGASLTGLTVGRRLGLRMERFGFALLVPLKRRAEESIANQGPSSKG